MMWLHNPSVYYQDYYHYKFALTFAYLYIQNSRTFVVNKFDFDTKMKRVSEKMHANYLIKLNKNKQIEKKYAGITAAQTDVFPVQFSCILYNLY